MTSNVTLTSCFTISQHHMNSSESFPEQRWFRYERIINVIAFIALNLPEMCECVCASLPHNAIYGHAYLWAGVEKVIGEREGERTGWEKVKRSFRVTHVAQILYDWSHVHKLWSPRRDHMIYVNTKSSKPNAFEFNIKIQKPRCPGSPMRLLRAHISGSILWDTAMLAFG